MAESNRVWDVPVRLFHWAIVILIAFSWWSAENEAMEWHQQSGLAICALILFRLIWGFLGSSTARFSQFLKGPAAVMAYLRSSEPWRGLGHNPVGGWSALLLMLVIAAQVTTGLFAVDIDGLESGPLSHFVDFDQGRIAAGIHHLNFDGLLVLAALHIAAVFTYLLIKRRNLITPMITGKQEDVAQVLIPAPLWRLALSLAITAGATYEIANGLRF